MDKKVKRTKKPTAIRIRNVSRNVTEAHLKEIFSIWGKPSKIIVPIDKKVQIALGYAIVEFDASTPADAALRAMDEGEIDGKKVIISFVEKKSSLSEKRGSAAKPKNSQKTKTEKSSRKRSRRSPSPKRRKRSPSPQKRIRSPSPQKRIRSPSPQKRTRYRKNKSPSLPKKQKDEQVKYRGGKTKRRSYSSTSSDI
ncbi:hypothetical protein MHBO_000720 [Bonamia ostreae]|uniref:RRM domain-containing protein n=1 Tax=Bonamia ostreae TaxID=126728 RepID=A0ABV2AHT2_9EUKA